MADNTQQNIQLTVQVLDNFISAKKNVDQWKQALNDAQNIGNAAKSTIDQLGTGLNQATALFDTATKAIQDMAGNEDLLGAVTQKADQIFGSLKEQIEALDGIQINIADPEKIKEVIGTVSTLKDQTVALGESIQNFDSSAPLSSLSGIAEAGNAVIGTIGTLSQQTGIEIEGFDQLATTAENVVSVIQTVQAVSESLQGVKTTLTAINLKEAASQAAEAVSTTASSLAMKILGTSAQTTSLSFKVLRGAIISTGIGALVVLLGVLISNWSSVVEWVQKATQSLGGFGKIFDQVKSVAMGVFEAIKNYVLTPFKAIWDLLHGNMSAAVDDIKNGLNIVGNFQKGYNEQQVKNEKATAAEKTKIQKEASDKAIAQQNRVKSAHFLAEADKLSKSIEVDRARGVSAQKLNQEEMKMLQDKIAGYKLALSTIKNINSEEYKDTKKKLEDAQQAFAVNRAKSQKQAQDDASSKKKKTSASATKKTDITNSDSEDFDDGDDLKASEKKLANDIKAINNLKDAKIKSAKGNAEQIAKINEEADSAIYHKKKEFQDKIDKLKTDALSFVKKTIDQEVAAERDKTDKEIAQLEELVDKKLITGQQLAEYTKKAEEQEAENIKNIKLKGVKEQTEQIKKATEDKYATEMALAAGNKQKQNQIQLKEQQEQLEALKKEKAKWQQKVDNETPEQADKNGDSAALKQNNLDVINMQNKVSASSLAVLNDEYAERIRLAKGNNEEIYRLKKELIDKQIALKEKGMTEEQKKEYENSEEYASLQDKKKEIDKQHTLEKIDQVKDWADKASSMAAQVNSVMKSLGDAEVQKAEDDNNAKKKSLQSQLNSGLITKKQYDKQVAKADDELAAKKKKIAQDQAKREKAINIFNAVVNTAAGVAKAISESPLTFGMPFAAYVAASGIAQIATIAATPLPKASKGMLLRGRSHAAGGIPIEAEGGEAIINKRSTALYAPLLSTINEAGGGVKFAAGGVVGRVFADGGIANTTFANDGGYSARAQANTVTAADMHEAMLSAVSKVKVYTTVEDYRKADANYTNIESSGTV